MNLRILHQKKYGAACPSYHLKVKHLLHLVVSYVQPMNCSNSTSVIQIATMKKQTISVMHKKPLCATAK